MSQQSATASAVILTSASQWYTWLSIIEANAKQMNIWDYIDPSRETEIPHIEPILPPRSTAPGNTPEEKSDAYADMLEKHRRNLKLYDNRVLSLIQMLQSIQKSISPEYVPYVLGKATPYEALRALQTGIAPNSDNRLLEVDQQYRRLCEGLPRGENLGKWLNKWEKVYAEAKAIKHSDVESGLILTYFINSLKPLDPGWASSASFSLQKERRNGLPTSSFMDILSMFRQTIINRPESSDSLSANAASLQGRPPNPRGSRTPSPIPPGECVCGVKHWFSECPYLEPATRPRGWKSNAQTAKKVEEALKDPVLKEKVERSREKQKERRKRIQERIATSASSTTSNQPGAELPASFATIWQKSNAADVTTTIPTSYSVDKAVNYDILNCWILDSGSNIHVCNNPARFQTTHTTTHQDYLVSGSTTYPIEAYGTVDIVFDTPTGQKIPMKLRNVALIPGFFTNLVSFSRAIEAGIYWHTKKNTLYTETSEGRENHFCLLKPHNGHWIVEYNDPPTSAIAYASSAASNTSNTSSPSTSIELAEQTSPAASSAAASTNKTLDLTPTQLHQIMGHAGAEAITKLQSAVDGVKLSSPCAKDEFISCEACRLSKAHRIIVRSSDSEVPSTRPLQRIAYDLIQMSTGFNNDQYISHFVCESTGYHWVWTHSSKAEATKIVRQMIDLAKHYKLNICFIRTDDEQALGNVFKAILKENGIISERTAPYTPDQNGKIERSGRSITTKARCMRMASNLPHDLWPEIVSTAAYILNRTPVFKTGKTPFERLYGSKPRIAHMKPYGCRAYPLIYNLPKLPKLEPRAHIGYLVGYDSRNIYRIWVPSKHKIIRIRDVTFDEKTFYRLDDVDAAQLVQEQEFYQSVQVLQEIPNSLLAHNQDEDEMELPSTIKSTTTTSNIDKNPNPVTTNQERAYMSPPASETGGPAGSSSPPHGETPARTTGEDVGETIGEGNGERPWEYRPVGAPAPRSTDISANLDANNVLPIRTRNRQHAHAVAINQLPNHAGYHAAFATNPLPKVGLHRDRLTEEPKNWKAMLKHPHSQQFAKAALKEFEHLQSRGTFKIALRPTNKQVLPLVWVFKYKFDDAGYLAKHKARLCVRGDLQKTEQDTAAATLAIRVFRALMALTASFNLTAKQYDAVNAFINSVMNEEVFVDYPEGMALPPNVKNPCFLLLRALYGLKQSPLLWLQEVTSTLLDLGLYSVPGVDCLFTNDWLILFFYVDDFVVLYRAEDEERFKAFEKALLAAYEIRSLGNLSWFLGIRIIRSDDMLYLCQDSYIEKIAEKYSATAAGPHTKTPLTTDPLVDYDGVASSTQIYAYQQRIGSLTFAATTTRPDISFATAKLAQYLTNPSPIHIQAANRVLSYLYHTRQLAIAFSKAKENPIFLSSSDAAFADDSKTRKSSFGYLIQLYGGPVDWKASKQSTVTTSSTEAELLALSETGRQTIWWKRFFKGIQFDTKQPMLIHCDNKQTLDLIQNNTPRLSTRLKHVDVHSCWLRQEVQAKRMTTVWTPTAQMPADGLTKALPNQKHQSFLRLLNMVDVSDLITASSTA